MFLMIDHYDSFTYNIVHYIEGMNESIIVRQPHQLSTEDIREMQPEGILLSPGPGHPVDATLTLEVIRTFAGQIPILGICLGFQTIVTAFGGKVEKRQPVHGHTASIHHDGKGIYMNLKSPLNVARYHSLQATELPDCLEVSATADDIIMAIRHRDYLIEGVQYHPESILTEEGHAQFQQFMRMCRR
ncbi:aminodeoxychorismate/anthranilate synthase component II [Macrococcus hajekii]|uniref:Aminodeoxychorismate/anthranilate synthase component II n=1 Tax=Macrococcus hajekii TaxID=198482 RepID=A0A4R6BIN5_9STAP|nr:aminodeoxychorismate/anthranilate synthase component II [Macrococcus hajekii]TDM01513.1 aminodeoxychorismate/anthranilate synthase component II [Macrococcus hajekii]GGB00592.1 aminodeoxychorismate/anthranilate synthase component II [Macrococcus hajekii]